MALPDAHAHVLAALRDGAELLMHTRETRGPYYTLGGRRLSVVLLKELEGRQLIARAVGQGGRRAAPYTLTPAGEAALSAWENPGSVTLP